MKVGNYYIGRPTAQMGGEETTTTEEYPIYTTISTTATGQIIFQPRWEDGSVSHTLKVNSTSATSGKIVPGGWLEGYNFSGDDRCWRLEAVTTEERLTALINTASTALTGYQTPANDTESAYYTDGTECGYITTTTQKNTLQAAVDAAQEGIDASAAESTLLELFDQLEAAYYACEAQQSLPEDGGYYYIIHGYAGDSNKYGVAFAMCNNEDVADGKVYKKALHTGDANFIFKLTKNGDNWYIQNLATSKYFGTYSDGVQLADTPVDQVLSADFLNNQRWSTGAKGRIRWNIYNTTDGDSQTYYGDVAGSAGAVLKVTSRADGDVWWQHGWILRPVPAGDLDLAQTNKTVAEAGYSTLYRPFATQVGDGATAYYVKEVADGNAVLEPFADNKIPANTGAVIRGTKGEDIVMANCADVAFSDTNLLAGSNVDEVVSEDDSYYYFISGRKSNGEGGYNYGWYFPNGIGSNHQFTNKAHKAYIKVLKTVVDDAGAAKGLGIVWGDETSVSELRTNSGAAASAYNLQGQRVAEGYKGIVIMNGKKVIKK